MCEMPERPEHFDCMKNNAGHADVRGPDGDTGACASLWEIGRSLAFRGNSLVLRMGIAIRSSIPPPSPVPGEHLFFLACLS